MPGKEDLLMSPTPMVGGGVEPPPLPSRVGLSARLAARGIAPRKVSAKRSWPPGCGRFPARAGAGDGEKAADGRADEAAGGGGVPPAAQNDTLPLRGQDMVEVAAIHPAASPVVQNGALSEQGQNKAEEVADAGAASPVKSNGVVRHTPPRQGPEQVGEEGDRVENSKVGSLINDTDMVSLDAQDENIAVQVAVPVVAVSESDVVGASSSVQNGGEGAGLLADRGVNGDVARDGAAGDADGRENGNKPAGGELERKMDRVEGRRKRWLTSALNPPPRRRAISAVRKFPPGCGRTTVSTKGSADLEVSPVQTLPPGDERAAVSTDDSGVSEVSSACAFPPGSGNSSDTIDGSAVLEVLPIRAYPSGCGRVSVATTGSGDEEWMQLGAATISNSDARATEALAAVPNPGWSDNVKVEGKSVKEKRSTKEHNKIQESRVVNGTSPVDLVGVKLDNDLPPNVVTKASPNHGFTDKMKGNLSPPEGKHVTQVVGGDKVRGNLDGSLRKDNFKTPPSRPIDANGKGKISDGENMNAMQKKTLSTKKELMPSNNTTMKDVHKKGKLTTTNQIEENNGTDLIPEQIIVQALMAPDKCPWRKGRKSISSASKSCAPRKKLKGKSSPPRIQLPPKKSTSNEDTIDDNEDSNDEDDCSSRELVLYDDKREKKEFSMTLPPTVPSTSYNRQSGNNDVDARRRVRKLLQKFQGLCRKFMQADEQRLRSVGRIDFEAINVLKQDPIYTKLGAIVGNVPGVEVGDEFHFRVELSLVGLHRPPQAGIDAVKVNGVPIAISIVASGGYPDELPSSDELIYTGSGGKACGKKEAEDQKLLRGNLALKNCIESKTPVRVIHGFKGQSRGEIAHSKGKQVSTYTYDGLYNVVECWQECLKGAMVFKYRLQRIPGQPQLALHVVKETKTSKVREGLLLPDISHGRERMPICVINTIDDLKPTPFKYVTKIIYPPWYKKEPPKGCDCKNGCSDSVKCACAVKNGGEIPYNFNGAIVEAKTLIYECGPSCRCPPTCHNRVSQHGIKIPLEIFKTGSRGWGVRSLSSIASGSFICEYAGELLQDKEAENRENDEYLFDIGSNYQDEELWDGLKSIPGLGSSTSSSKTMEGFTIDAAECGNVGRFINHSCSPNLYAQNVLWDHDDVEKPHVMLFAVENIPPLQELTYHYNYNIGEVRDQNGDEKVKHCYCGSSDCSGRLY